MAPKLMVVVKEKLVEAKKWSALLFTKMRIKCDLESLEAELGKRLLSKIRTDNN